MWHEARRQEKMVRARMVDNVKRNERRKMFYESVRKEPEGFMQLHGQKMPVHVDPLVAESINSQNAMRKWQGDPSVLIDRFDVRGYLDHLPEAATKQSKKNMSKDDVVEMQCDYERYRILVFNEYRKVGEKHFLNEIAEKEFWPAHQHSNQSSNATYKKEIEKKKKLIDQRAAIAFTYADSETVQGSSSSCQRGKQRDQSPSSSSDEDYFEGVDEIDTFLDPDILTAEQAAILNKIGFHYNITSGAFLQLLNLDRREQSSTAQIREIDKAKLALSGRNAKADRAVLKRRRALIIGDLGSTTQTSEEATTTLLSFLASANRKELNEDSSSSESQEEYVKTEFITSFGGEEEKETKKKSGEIGDEESTEKYEIVQGPVLPNKEYRRLLELSRRRSISPKNTWEQKQQDERCRRDGHRRFSRSPRRRRSRDRDPKRRSRSSSRSRPHRRRRYSSSTSSSPSPKRALNSSHSKRKDSRYEEHRRNDKRNVQKDKPSKARNSSSSSSRDHLHKHGNGSGFQHITPNSRDGRNSPTLEESSSISSDESDSPLRIHTSMSESEKERIERENRKRRIRRTKRMVKTQQQNLSESIVPEDLESRAERAAKKLRQQMHKALTKTAAQLKEEEEQRQRELVKEKKKRDEQMLEESRLLRKRAREKCKIREEREHRGRERSSGHRSSRHRKSSSSPS